MKAPNVFHIIFSKIFSNLTKCGRSSSSRTSSVTSHTSFGTSRFLNHSTAAFYYPSYFPILLSNEGSKLFSHNIFLILSKWRPKPHIFQKFTNKVLLSNLTKAQKLNLYNFFQYCKNRLQKIVNWARPGWFLTFKNQLKPIFFPKLLRSTSIRNWSHFFSKTTA